MVLTLLFGVIFMIVGAIIDRPRETNGRPYGYAYKYRQRVLPLLLIRMFSEHGRGELCSPANNRKTKTGDQWSPLQTNFGRALFSLPICVIIGATH